MQGAGQFLYPLPTPPRAPWRGPFPPWQQRGPPGQKPAPNQTARVSRQVSIAGRSRIYPRKAKLREPPAAWRANCPPHGARTAVRMDAPPPIPTQATARAAREYTLAKLNCANRPPHGARIARRMAQKNSRPIGRLLFQCWRTPIFPGRHQPSIFGTNELNFRVRDGNGWTLVVINTNYSLSSGSPDSFLMIPLLSPNCKHFFRDFYTFLPFYHI